MHHLLVLATNPLTLAGAILVAGFLATRLARRHSSLVTFVCQLGTFAGFTFMLAAAGVTPTQPTPAMGMTITYLVVSLFKMVWWIAASWLLAGFVRTILVFKRRPVETQFLQDLCAGIIYVGAILGIIAYVFDLAISGLLAASGVIAIVLGLALQSTLGDLFSGVVLNLANPYHPGDWIILDGGLEGRVIETNWRATQILTDARDTAVVPNSIIAKARIINASRPSAPHGITIRVRLDPAETPSRVVAVLETALLSCNLILRLPGDGQIEVLRLAPGDFFGQASVLTGAVTAFKVRALTKVTVYEIGLEDMAPILKERPAIAAELSQIMLRREATGKALLDELVPEDNHTTNFSARITERVKHLFGID